MKHLIRHNHGDCELKKLILNSFNLCYSGVLVLMLPLVGQHSRSGMGETFNKILILETEDCRLLTFNAGCSY